MEIYSCSPELSSSTVGDFRCWWLASATSRTGEVFGGKHRAFGGGEKGAGGES